MTPPATTPRSPLSLTDLIRARLATTTRLWPTESDRSHLPRLRRPRLYEALDLTHPSRRRAGGERDGDPLSGLVLPALVVVCAADRAAPNLVPDPDTGGVLQRVTSTLLLYVGVPARNDPGGTRGTTDLDLDRYVAHARRDLLAWAPEGQFPGGRWAPLELRSGRIEALRDGRAWWIDTYETHRLMRGAPPPEAPGVVPSTVHSQLHEADPSHGRGRLTGEAAC